jgi:predicted TIM-barrel fold metal-dependent hydrolase
VPNVDQKYAVHFRRRLARGEVAAGGDAEVMTAEAPWRVDVHHHILPDFYREEMQDQLRLVQGSMPVPSWSREKMISMMDAAGIATAMTSVSAPGVWRGDARAAATLARRCNEYSAEFVASNPGRIGAFAVLPLPDVDAAQRELAYALDELQLDGVTLLSNHAGVYLGDPMLEDLFVELDRRRSVVFLHPTFPQAVDRIALSVPAPILEFVFDTTRAVANLIYGGTLDRYAAMRIIVSHAGGAIPYLAGRIGLGAMLPEFSANAPKGVAHYLRNLYYDTALSSAPSQLRALQHLADPSHILFGSDTPFAHPAVVALITKGLSEYGGFDAAALAAIETDNALALLPRLTGAASGHPTA